MAKTAQSTAPADLFAQRDLSKHLRVDRVLTARPASYWIWPFKKWIPAYQVQKGRSYQREGLSILQSAEEDNEKFQQGPAQLEALRREHAHVAEDLRELCETPETVSAEALRRYKRRARRSRNNIVIASEAFVARGTYCIAVGAKDDTGMPSSVTSVTTSNLPPPRRDLFEIPDDLTPRPADAEPFTAPENQITDAMTKLAIVTEVHEEESLEVPPTQDELIMAWSTGIVAA